ncbi:MAG: hypothetical protein AABX52_02720 [Nanoarchaeota archaeon]
MPKQNRLCCPNKNQALKICSILFAVIALAHLLRVLMGVMVTAGNIEIPIMASIIAAIVTGYLSWWTYKARGKN